MNQKQREASSDAQLQELLEQYNKIDKRKMGSIKLSQGLKLLKQTSNITLLNQDILERIVFNTDRQVTFDEFLALKYQAQIQYGIHKDLVNYKMLSFLKLLEDYRKKCQESSLYTEAQKANQKIQQIKQKQMKRHKQKLLLQQKSKVLSVNSLQQGKLLDFNNAWNEYMQKYQQAAINSIQKLKAKHLQQMQEQQDRVKSYYENYLKPSKKVLDLKSRQKILVKQKHYMEAQKVKHLVHKLQSKQRQSKTVQISQRMKKRKQTLQKHQQASLLAHLKRIQKDRNQQIKQRQMDSQKMLIKLKNIQNQIVQKQSIQIRQTLDNLRETMCLSTSMFRNPKNKRFKSAQKLPHQHPLLQLPTKQKNKSFKIRVNSFHRTKIDDSLYNP